MKVSMTLSNTNPPSEKHKIKLICSFPYDLDEEIERVNGVALPNCDSELSVTFFLVTLFSSCCAEEYGYPLLRS